VVITSVILFSSMITYSKKRAKAEKCAK
jgi:hypothetical protein